ncbi:MAG: DUF58 domain-containing protein [Lachnospiraceae bacterium]|nr:DUF58 domain-containing protein [Lachnospiraceae bacterium]
MIMNYVTKIRAKVNIYASKKSSNLFDGSYKSIYQGNGMDFENLREYIPGDNVRDMDWKASSRSGKMLVKRYIAEKRHNILLVFDTGKKMTAHTKNLEIKKDLALNVGGIFGYLAAKNGDNVGALYNRNGFIQYHQLRTGMQNIERILTLYDKEKFEDYESDLEKSLDYIVKNVNRKMIVFVISDATGIRDVSDSTLKKLTGQHDVLFVRIGDADYASGTSYNHDKDIYIPEYITRNKKLLSMEQETKQKLDKENAEKLLRYRIISTQIDGEKEMVEQIIELLEKHKYACNC